MLRELMEYEEEQYRREMEELDAIINEVRVKSSDTMCYTRLSRAMSFEVSLRRAVES